MPPLGLLTQNTLAPLHQDFLMRDHLFVSWLRDKKPYNSKTVSSPPFLATCTALLSQLPRLELFKAKLYL